MAVINTKFNVGDKVYFIDDFLDINTASDVSDLFENAIDNINDGEIIGIEITDKGINYKIKNHSFSEESLYLTLKDAYIKIMTVLKTELENCYLNAKCVLENSEKNFEKCCEEYGIKC